MTSVVSVMQWRAYARPTSFRWMGLTFFLLCCVGGPLMIVAGLPIASVFFFAFGVMGFPFCFPVRLRAEVNKDHVRLRPPPLYRNPLVGFPAAIGSMGVSAVAQSVIADDEDGGRFLLYGIALIGAAAFLAVHAYRVRGAVDLSARWVTFVHGRRYSITDDSFGLYVPRNSAPAVKLMHAADPGGRPSYMPTRIYGFDVNTMLSTLEQLRIWAGAGQQVAPATIMAMLDVEPPSGVGEGESVAVSIRVPDPPP